MGGQCATSKDRESKQEEQYDEELVVARPAEEPEEIRITCCCSIPGMVSPLTKTFTLWPRHPARVLKQKLAVFVSVEDWLILREPHTKDGRLTQAHYTPLCGTDFRLQLSGDELTDDGLLTDQGLRDESTVIVLLDVSKTLRRAECVPWHPGLLYNVSIVHPAQLVEWSWERFCAHVGRKNGEGFQQVDTGNAVWSCCVSSSRSLAAGVGAAPCSYRQKGCTQSAISPKSAPPQQPIPNLSVPRGHNSTASGAKAPLTTSGQTSIGPPSRSAGPPSRSAGPPSRSAGPPSRSAGPPSRSAGPPSRSAGPPSRWFQGHPAPVGGNVNDLTAYFDSQTQMSSELPARPKVARASSQWAQETAPTSQL